MCKISWDLGFPLCKWHAALVCPETGFRLTVYTIRCFLLQLWFLEFSTWQSCIAWDHPKSMWKLWFGINFDEPGSTLWCPLYFPVWQWPIRIRVGGSTKKRERNNNKSLRKGQDSWEWTKKVANWSGIHLIENCSRVNLFKKKNTRISW